MANRPDREKFGRFKETYALYGDAYQPQPHLDVLCYDTETSGVDRAHGQIYQFGAIRADADLRTLETFETKSRRLPYVVASPGALRVTGLDTAEIDGPDRLEEYEATAEIARALALPPEVKKRLLITYNGQTFDDPLLRHTLDRNLRNPDYWIYPRRQGRDYHVAADGLRVVRIDMLPVMQLAASMRPGEVRHAFHEDGKPSFKLETIAPMNGIPVRAHDAFGDASATLDLARWVRTAMKDVWLVARRGSDEEAARKFLMEQKDLGETVWHFQHFGKPSVVPLTFIPLDGFRCMGLDLLRLEEPYPEGLGPNDVQGLAFGTGARVSNLKLGNSPLLLTEAEAATMVPPGTIAAARKAAAEVAEGRHAALIGDIARRLRSNRYVPPPAETSEMKLGWTRKLQGDDIKRIRSFHAARDWTARAAIEFGCPRLRDFAARLVAMHCDLDALARHVGEGRVAEIRRDSAAAFRRPFVDDGPWTSLAAAMAAEEADDDYREWARAAYDPGETHPRTVPVVEPVQAQARLF